MGPEGFISCFDHLMGEQALKRKLILKGGPGVGKSTFMRRLHAALCTSGEPSTLYFCSGDPDSLDAVAIAHKGLLVLDGTAPHVVDPQIPGARDSIINLGRFLDEAALRPRLAQIKTVMAAHAACTRRAGACLRAALPLSRDNAALIASAIDPSRMEPLLRALIESALTDCPPAAAAAPSPRPVITDAVTPKGEITLLSEGVYARVIRLCGPAGMDFTPALRAVSAAAQAKGGRVFEHLHPRIPGALLHLSLPDCGLLITTGESLASEQLFDLGTCVPHGALLRHECALEQGRAAENLLIKQAVSALVSAKALHDELESFYVPNMDFAHWQKELDKTLASL